MTSEVVTASKGSMSPSIKTKLNRYGHFMSLVMTKAWFNMKAESARTYLSHAWVALEPILHLAIYYFIFGKLLSGGVENYGLFLLCGLIPWMWFAKAVATSSSSILSGQGLMMQIGISPAFFPIVSVVQSTMKQLPALALVMLVGIASGPAVIGFDIVYLPLLIVLQFLFTLAFSLLVAAIIPFVRDLSNLIGTGLTLMMFTSGIIYNYKGLPVKVQAIIELNPMTLLIADYRAIIMGGRFPDSLPYLSIVITAMLLLSGFVYWRLRFVFPRKGME